MAVRSVCVSDPFQYFLSPSVTMWLPREIAYYDPIRMPDTGDLAVAVAVPIIAESGCGPWERS